MTLEELIRIGGFLPVSLLQGALEYFSQSANIFYRLCLRGRDGGGPLAVGGIVSLISMNDREEGRVVEFEVD